MGYARVEKKPTGLRSANDSGYSEGRAKTRQSHIMPHYAPNRHSKGSTPPARDVRPARRRRSLMPNSWHQPATIGRSTSSLTRYWTNVIAGRRTIQLSRRRSINSQYQGRHLRIQGCVRYRTQPATLHSQYFGVVFCPTEQVKTRSTATARFVC